MFKIKFFVFIIFLSFFLLFLSSNSYAWDDCPFGYKDDPYPGLCWRYIDTDKDGICDHSQFEKINYEEELVNNSNLESKIQNTNKIKENKNLIILVISFFIIFILFLVIKYLVKIQKLSSKKENIFWNLLLLIFFLPSALTGIILVLMVNFTILREIGFNFIELHSYTSFFFMWISGYHLTRYRKYYIKNMKNLFKNK
jgi:hypothetical protein